MEIQCIKTEPVTLAMRYVAIIEAESRFLTTCLMTSNHIPLLKTEASPWNNRLPLFLALDTSVKLAFCKSVDKNKAKIKLLSIFIKQAPRFVYNIVISIVRFRYQMNRNDDNVATHILL